MAARVIDTLEELERLLEPGRLRPRRPVNGRRYVMVRVRPSARQRVANTIDVEGLGRCDLVRGDFVAHVLAPRHKVEAFVARETRRRIEMSQPRTFGRIASHSMIRRECRDGRGDAGAFDEAVNRARAAYERALAGWRAQGKEPVFHLVLGVDPPEEIPAGARNVAEEPRGGA